MSGKTTITEPDFESGGASGLAVLVISPDGFASFPLPAGGAVSIGRSDDCEIHLDDPLASRRHARLHVTPALAIEDLQSANRTRVRDQIISGGTTVPIALGETITIGSTLLVVRPAQDGAGVGRVWAHRWFETRVREECAGRAGANRFALARLSLEHPVPWYRVVSLIDRCIAPPHLFAAYGPHDYEFLFFDADRAEAGRHLERIRTGLSPLEVDLRAGIACFPADGRSADALMERANDELRPRDLVGAGRLADPGATSPAMAPVLELAHKAAGSSISVLILGETGVGKEVMAQTIHRLSTRATMPWVALNCAGLPESLVESELFGHERGAFTGATHAKKGLFEAAHGGTLFLDEIGEMSLATQARLLRALANREIMPVGSTRARSIDVRIIAATHRDLTQDVASGKFRRGPVLSTERVHPPHSAPAQSARRDRTLGEHFSDRAGQGVGPSALHSGDTGARTAAGVPLAGQHSSAEEHTRTRPGALRWGRHRPEAPSGRTDAPSVRVPAAAGTARIRPCGDH